jgi:ParB-like chromosome segregation protein Spo0J
LDKYGLVEPLVWNRRTGNLVGGHQRLAILDEEEGKEYELTVSAIDVDAETEKKINVFLNNTSAMGSWDQDALEKLVLDLAQGSPLVIEDLGFDPVELQLLCDSEAVGDLFMG